MEQEEIRIIDFGNTHAKVGCFIHNELCSVERVEWNMLLQEEHYQSVLKKSRGMFSSVLSPEQNALFLASYPQFLELSKFCTFPIKMNYDTPHSLGSDRICNAVGAWSLNPNQHSLVVDIGTCIKFDLVTKDGVYQGGSISPGVRLRYQSLNDYTANLPLLEDRNTASLVGKSTYASIHSGVMRGIFAEIRYLIEEYQQNYESLTIFVTGGDAKHFDFASKNNIFANENLTLIGLYEIYLLNA